MKNIWMGALMGTLALAGNAWAAPAVQANDEAGNYTLETFINGANLGTGFGVWDIWNTPATLEDSTAGGGGDLNSTNGYSFCFKGDGAGSWCNARRNFAAPLQDGDELTFTFTYNWDGGGRGVDIFCATGQFANLINVQGGNTFQVNGNTISTNYSPGAVVSVKITQEIGAIQMDLTRTVSGETNLTYTTNIVNPDGATGISMYCGGYTCDPGDNNNYAIFMNDLQIFGEDRRSLEFSAGVWNPPTPGAYAFELTRSGAVGDEIALNSDNEAAVTVPATVTFDSPAATTVAFDATVVSVTNGDATIYATNLSSGARTEYTLRAPHLAIDGPWEVYAAGPVTYTLTRIAGISNTVSLSSSTASVMSVTGTATFNEGEDVTTFQATALTEGSTTLAATDPANGVKAEFNVTFYPPALVLGGPASIWEGETKSYTVTRYGPAGETIYLSSSDTNVLTVPDSVTFASGDVASFDAVGVAVGTATITAWSDDLPEGDTLDVEVTAAGTVVAFDEANNYTPATFVNGANEGFGFGAWDFWNDLATLGDSTAGGGGDINSANGLSFRFMGDASGSWCNARRNFAAPLQAGDVMSFTFTYNWDGGQRGVDIFCATGQFANLINVQGGNTFQVNGNTISTEYSPGAVVAVEITQSADGIQMDLVRTVGGVPNLTYSTNIVQADPATGVSMYCGGHADARPEINLVNYAVFMNDLQIVGTPVAAALFLTGPTEVWAGTTPTYTLTRQGEVGDVVTLGSSALGVMTVPATATFPNGQNSVTFQATPVGAGATVLSAGNADATATPLNVTVAVRPEYLAYDDASLYADGDWVLAPAHVTGFSDWTEWVNPDPAPADVYRGRFIGASPIGAINENGVAFGLYANHYLDPEPDPLPEVKMLRSFPAPMVVGQTFSVDVGYNWSGGTKGIKLKGDFEGTAYDRFELFNSGNDTWSYKLDGGDPVVAWSGYVEGGFRGRVQAICTGENTFTFSLQRDGEDAVLVENVILPGSIDQIEFYNYNGGSGEAENFYFNRMWLSEVAGPVGPGIASISFNPATDEISFTIPSGYTLVRVEGADCQLVGNGFDWQPVPATDYTVVGSEVTILTDDPMRQMIRVVLQESGTPE